MSLKEMLPVDNQLKVMDDERLILLLQDPSAIVKSRAIATLSHRLNEKEYLKTVLLEQMVKDENRSAYFFGSIKVSHLAFIALLAYATGDDKKRIQNAVNENWPKKDKEILYGYLKSETSLELDSTGELHIV